MLKTTKKELVSHLAGDLGLQKDGLVFMHSGLTGLGFLEKGLDTITEAFAEVLSEGLLVIPSFTYSWCKGEVFNPSATECPSDVGSYSQEAWKDGRFVRSSDPNFAVAALKNESNADLIEAVFQTGKSCFGKNSVFDHMYQLARERNGHIILLGGAHSDAVFRTTFIHYVEELVGVPNRYLKKFYNPVDPNDFVEQLVRFVSEEEYRAATGGENSRYKFPVKFDYALLGEDLLSNDLLVKKIFAYSETRMVNIKAFYDFLEKQLRRMPDYCVAHESILEVIES